MRRRIAARIADIEAAGYRGVWHGQKGFNGVAILARGEARGCGGPGCPAIPTTATAAISRPRSSGVVVASLYLPNGNPQSAPRNSTTSCAGWSGSAAMPRELLAAERPVVLAGDWNVVPEDRDVFSVRATQHDAVMQPETRAGLAQDRPPGLDRCAPRAAPGRAEALHLLGLYGRLLAARRGFRHRPSALLARSRRTGCAAPASTAGRAARRKPATTRRPGSNWPTKAPSRKSGRRG